ncbi:MAG: 4Fe-4S dicluster domain-containing protein [Anaerolineaceae bacterium]
MYQKLVRFYADDTCKRCGQCVKLCLSGRIEMAGGRPRWNLAKRCYACFACINFCPKHSIQVLSRFPLNSATSVNQRYHHPDLTWRDIAAQRSDGN